MSITSAVCIARAVKELCLDASDFRQQASDVSMQSLQETQTTFLTTGDPAWWWEHLREPNVGIACDQGCLYLSRLCPDQHCYLIPLDADRKTVYIARPTVIQQVLSECPAFEYAVVDPKMQWILIENHHDVLIAVGEPVINALRALKTA